MGSGGEEYRQHSEVEGLRRFERERHLQDGRCPGPTERERGAQPSKGKSSGEDEENCGGEPTVSRRELSGELQDQESTGDRQVGDDLVAADRAEHGSTVGGSWDRRTVRVENHPLDVPGG